MQGFDNASAVRMALEETGPLISLAGRRWGEVTEISNMYQTLSNSYQILYIYILYHIIYTFARIKLSYRAMYIYIVRVIDGKWDILGINWT